MRDFPARPTIGVVGLGLIGGSVALRLSPRHSVIGWDDSSDARTAARAGGIQVVEALAELAAQAHVIMVATPLRAMPATFAAISSALGDREDVIVTDVGSVKVSVEQWAVDAGLGSRFVAGHPMAGTEQTGFAFAQADLFRGATWALCLSADTDIDRWLILADLLISATGCTVISPTAADHDVAVATISHAPHVVSSAVLNSLGDDAHFALAAALAAGSFHSITRVAGTNAERTDAMVAENAANIAPRLRVIAAALSSVAGALESGDSARTFFEKATDTRERINSMAGANEVVALHEDAPSQLSDLARAGRRVVAVDPAARTVVVR